MSRISSLCLLLLALSFSAGASAANVWKNNLPVSSIMTYPNGDFLLILEASDPNCGPSGNLFYVLSGLNGQTADGVKAALAMALTAFTSGKTVSVYTDTAVSNCPVQLVRINP
jgi:hypothetical protein